MKVELAKDPLFEVKQSPLKQLKEKSRERQKEKKLKKQDVNYKKKKELDIEVIDPLPIQLNEYKDELSYIKIAERSKACQNLKRYIVSQQRKQQQEQNSLKHIRLDRIKLEQMSSKNESMNHSTASTHKEIKINFAIAKDQEKLKDINIPKIEQLFKNQIRDNLIFENHQLCKRLQNKIGSMEDTMKVIKGYTNPNYDDPKYKSQISSNISQIKNQGFSASFIEQRQQDIDVLIEKKLIESRNFRQKLYNQKRLINRMQENLGENKDLVSILKQNSSLPKKKISLEGIKSYSVKQGSKLFKFSPPGMLLHELHRLSDEKQKKQLELTSLLKNSYQNRNDILDDKSSFYDNKTSFHDLSPSSQFKLRVLMDKKLSHRLELSKEQVHKFVDYLQEIKNYHTVINSAMISILMEIRTNLLGGKVMKNNDLQLILAKYDAKQLQEGKNSLIISKLKNMMI